MRVCYVAGKFRGANAWEVAQNVRRAEETALEVWKSGAVALCPHLNSQNFSGVLPDRVWLKGDIELLSRCDAVVMVEGWEGSIGAQAERLYALRKDLPVFHSLEDFLGWQE